MKYNCLILWNASNHHHLLLYFQHSHLSWLDFGPLFSSILLQSLRLLQLNYNGQWLKSTPCGKGHPFKNMIHQWSQTVFKYVDTTLHGKGILYKSSKQNSAYQTRGKTKFAMYTTSGFVASTISTFYHSHVIVHYLYHHPPTNPS